MNQMIELVVQVAKQQADKLPLIILKKRDDSKESQGQLIICSMGTEEKTIVDSMETNPIFKSLFAQFCELNRNQRLIQYLNIVTVSKIEIIQKKIHSDQ
jgi:hypothetical protein